MGPIFSKEAIEKTAALIPGGRQIIVEGTGHDIHVDKPEALIASVVEMIEEVRKKTEN